MRIEQFSVEHYQEAVTAIRGLSRQTPKIGMVLGSGLSDLANEVENREVIAYGEIPHFPLSTVAGHDGRLVFGTLDDAPVLVMQGRAHFYEGHSMARVTFPIRVMKLLGIEVLLLTNAAGGLNPEFRLGDLMLISDHINLPGMVGLNPLVGPNESTFGPRFPDMTNVYDSELRSTARRVAAQDELPLREGIYVMLTGPHYETPAEIRFLRSIGADAVGMSTLPEATAARHCGLRVLGISGITNVCIPDPSPGYAVSHEHVLEAGKVLTPRFVRLIRGILKNLA